MLIITMKKQNILEQSIYNRNGGRDGTVGYCNHRYRTGRTGGCDHSEDPQ